MSDVKDLIIIGAGGMGREVLQWIKDINAIKPTWNILGFIDDNINALNEMKCSHKIIDTLMGHKIDSDIYYVMGIASPELKKNISKKWLESNAQFASIIHPTAIIAEEATIGNGVIIYPYCIVSDNTRLGDFVGLNLYTSIGHDAVVGNYTTISAHCDITGGVKIGNEVFLGTHASIVPRVKVKDNVTICAGSVVMNNISAGKKVLGNPAKKFEI